MERDYATAKAVAIAELHEAGCRCDPAVLGMVDEPWRLDPHSTTCCMKCGRAAKMPPADAKILRDHMKPPQW